MAARNATAIVSTYATEAAALSDYTAVERLFTNDLTIDALNAAVISRRTNGKVEIVRRRERSALGPVETERLIGHMSRVGLKNVGFDELMPGQSMLIVVATGDAWTTFDLENEIILSGDTEVIQATVDPAVVFDDTLVVTDV